MPWSAKRPAEALAKRVGIGAAEPLPPIRPLRYPVVLMHGFGAMANVGRGGVFRREASHLRQRGVWAYAPTTNPYDTLDVRASTWKLRIEEALAETGAERVNLIGFSTGGLDARLVASDRAWHGRIASIVTVSTPHHGTALAQYVLDRPARLRSAVLGIMDVVGRAAFDEAPPNVADAVAELTPDAVAARFPPDETVEGAFCASYAGRAGRGTDISIFPPLVLSNRILYPLAGENDGIVPTESAWWGERLGVLDADHARQIGISIGDSSSFNSLEFFSSLCDLLRERGL